MARAGRKRKIGKRHPGGQLVRTPKYDKGTAELQLQRLDRICAVPADSKAIWLSRGAEAAIAGTMPTKAAIKRGEAPGVPPMRIIDTAETIDPVGRAWASGMLDGVAGISPEDLRDSGRRFAALYWRKLPGSSPVSSLYANMVSGLVDELPAGVDREQLLEDADARDIRQEQALNRILEGLRRLGRDVRSATDEITLDPFADAGPAWLDWLITARASVLPILNGAIGAGMMLSYTISSRNLGATVSGFLGLPEDGSDRLVTAADWYRFLPEHQILRWSAYSRRLQCAIDGLVLVYHGGRPALTFD